MSNECMSSGEGCETINSLDYVLCRVIWIAVENREHLHFSFTYLFSGRNITSSKEYSHMHEVTLQ